MGGLLPAELFDIIAEQCPCRQQQIRQLATFYSGTYPPPSVLVAYGLEDSSKIETIINVLEKRGIRYGIARTRECLSQRHLLTKIFAACLAACGQENVVEGFDKMDSINALLGNLRKTLERADGQDYVAVIEDIDTLKHPGPTLLPALARLGDLIPGFSLILTSSSPRPLALHKAGVPYLHFPPYTRSEAVSIVTSQRRSLLPHPAPSHLPDIDDQALSKIYTQFAITVFDSLISATSSTSIQVFRSTCDKLWPHFIKPMIAGWDPPGKARSWDFARLLVQGRTLFQSDGENTLYTGLPKQRNGRSNNETLEMRSKQLIGTAAELAPSSAPTTPTKSAPRHSETADTSPSQVAKLSKAVSTTVYPPLLKHFSTLVLLSCYLASHTPAKHDILLFSRLSSSSTSTSRKIRRLRQTPTKRKTAATPSGSASKEAVTPTRSRTKALVAANASFGIPRPFTIERLVAVLRAVHPHGILNRAGRGVSDQVYREVGELEKLRLVVRISGSAVSGMMRTPGAGSGAADDTGEDKWRVNVGRDWVVDMGKAWGMGVGEYEIEQDL